MRLSSKMWLIIFVVMITALLSLVFLSSFMIDDEPDLWRRHPWSFSLRQKTSIETPVKVEDTIIVIPIVLKEGNTTEEIMKKREAVKEAFSHAYHGYEDRCLGQNELKPITGNCHNWLLNDLPLTTIDALDTILMMGLTDEYNRALDHLKVHLNWDRDHSVSLFEITIRCLGGLISAHEISKDQWLLDSAKQLADKLLPGFKTATGIPKSLINLKTGRSAHQGWMAGAAALAEFGTIQLEFTSLSVLLNDNTYREKVENIYTSIKKILPSDFLVPSFVNVDTGQTVKGASISLGGLGDSYYEYLLKYWLLFDRKDKDMGKWYFNTANSIIQNLAVKSTDGMWMLAEKRSNGLLYKMEHLGCFAGGMFALGSLYIDDIETKNKHLEVAEGIGRFCWEMYNMTQTGLSPEHVLVTYVPGQKFILELPGSSGREWIMRPEALETWFVLWRITKNEKYRDWAWQAFQSMNKHARVAHGYSGIRDSNGLPVNHDDVQQSFFLAETLKYLYLIFSPDDEYPLDTYVFNTEAHPLLIFK